MRLCFGKKKIKTVNSIGVLYWWKFEFSLPYLSMYLSLQEESVNSGGCLASVCHQLITSCFWFFLCSMNIN
jgi:hypothetical protein